MTRAAITGTGVFTPPATITNEALVHSFNTYVDRYNAVHAQAIENGECEPLTKSDVAFIEKVSGIKQRYVLEPEGVLDPERMRPRFRARRDDELSIQAEMCVAAAREALHQAGRDAADVDCVILACSNPQRPYPAVAVEVQHALGTGGFAYDMNVACSSATFGIQQATAAIMAGHARCVLMVNPEIPSGHLNFRDRDSHFIFGDVCTAVLLEAADDHRSADAYEVLSLNLKTEYSNTIRNNFGFLNHAEDSDLLGKDKFFVQQGRKVFKDVVPMVVRLIAAHLDRNGLSAGQLGRIWLHQANINMNKLIALKLLGREAAPEQAPTILDDYANTASAGSIIAFHKHRGGINAGDHGLICSFGAGYSVGSVLVRKQ